MASCRGRLFFAPEPGAEPALPSFDGGPRFPEGAAPPAARDFTPRYFDPVRGELVIDFALHGAGPAATWAASAAPGAVVGQAGPRGSLVVSGFDWYLLAGDETALPAIGRRLEELPAGAHAIVIAEVADVHARAEQVRPLRDHLRLERGLPKEFTHITGYWKRGAADHHDPPERD